MKYYIISGEASGDLHASNLAKELFQIDPQAQIRAWGGDLLRKQGAEVVKDYKDLAFMGFVEVALNLRTILRNLKFCEEDILAYNPDVVILVDYPGFNLMMAEFLHKKQIKTFYYISPQVWAWHKSRIKNIKKYVDELFVILPFEKVFYADHGMNAHYLGHPLLDVVKNTSTDPTFRQQNHLSERPVVALLPGSRKQEILRVLPTMLKACRHIDGCQFVIAGVENHRNLYRELNKDALAEVVFGQTYNLLANSCAAMVTSGTATLETALFNVPQVVCYKGNYVSYLIAKRLIKGIDYISLVNLIADQEVVKELIQQDMNPQNLLHEMKLLLEDTLYREKMLHNYQQLRHCLGNGNTSLEIAKTMYGLLKKKYTGKK
ncbi:MAG: lipid-A-disaccharide synthase [Bacteroidales bacterium]|nr:lipid-A-disaccharide synthase [Bacteroidales bacterium]